MIKAQQGAIRLGPSVNPAELTELSWALDGRVADEVLIDVGRHS
jgi:hypothetical protein